MDYLISNDELLKKHSKALSEALKEVGELKNKGNKEEILECETRLLRELFLIKTRIDIIAVEDYVDVNELHNLRIELSIVNATLLLLVEEFPYLESAKALNKSSNK